MTDANGISMRHPWHSSANGGTTSRRDGEPAPTDRSERAYIDRLEIVRRSLHSEEFHKKLSSFCWQVTVRPRQLLTRPRGTVGVIGALNNVLIPYVTL